VIAGGAVLVGFGGGSFAITPVAAELAPVLPPAFVAVTRTRALWPTSVAASV
jgi:hypothetical protein